MPHPDDPVSTGTHVPAPPLPGPRHGLPVPALAASAVDVPPGVPLRDLGLIESLRHDVRRLDFDPLTDEQVASQAALWPTAAAGLDLDGKPLRPAEVALTQMLLEERVPADARPPIVARFVREAQTLRP